MRLIDADALKKALQKWGSDHWTEAFTGDDVCSEIEYLIDSEGAVNAAPVVYAHWIEDDYAYNRCSECGYELDEREFVTPYCPNCGANMDEEEDK